MWKRPPIKFIASAAITGVLLLGPFNSFAQASIQTKLKLLEEARIPVEFTEVISSLKKAGPEDSSALKSFADDASKDARKRIIALRAFLNLQKEARWLPELQSCIESDHDDHFRALCAEEIGYRKHPKAAKFLFSIIPSLNYPSRVQVSAAFALATLGDGRGKARALQAVTEAEPWANTGIRTLEKLKDASVLETLDKVAGSKTGRRRNKSELAALRVRLSLASDGEQVELLTKAVESSNDLEISKWAAMNLARKGNKDSGERLSAITLGGNPTAKHAASKALEMGVDQGYWSRSEVEAWILNGRKQLSK